MTEPGVADPLAATSLADALTSLGVGRGDLVGLAITPDASCVAVAVGGSEPVAVAGEAAALVAAADRTVRPRWVMWSQATAAQLVGSGTRVAVSWDVAAVHRLLFGEWRADVARAWARAHGLSPIAAPETGRLDLFGAAGPDVPADVAVGADGYLNSEWVAGSWAASPERVGRWAVLALDVAVRQAGMLAALDGRPVAPATARSESTAELLCAELATDGLPMDRSVAEAIIGDAVGPRPRNEAEAESFRAERDAAVLRHAPAGTTYLLRNPGHVKALLLACGLDVADTRAWRLEELRDRHPLIDDLLAWRKAERVATTFGYGWLDAHLGADGRLRGEWTASDGAAGRMTASAGLHNMPAEMRPAVAADAGCVFVRADLGQIEPRVLAAVAGDAALARAARTDDMYQPVATDLSVDRATAKVAVLGAMYGQTTGHGATALRKLDSAYPVAMAYLRDAATDGQVGRDIRTRGGRLVRLDPGDESALGESEARSRAAARGRFARNAAIQGAAAELFKMWAVTVRARAAGFGARIVLCLHDELLVHVPAEHGDAVASLLSDALAEAAHWWQPDSGVRFVADVAVVRRWSDAKG